MPPEGMELWARRFEIKEAFSGSGVGGIGSLFFLEDTWGTVLQLPAFPNGQHFGWGGTPGAA